MLWHCISSRSPATTVTRLLRSTGARRRLTTTNDAVNLEANRNSSSGDALPSTDIRPGPETTLKRFWKDVGIEKRGESYAVTLDKRPLKTPSGNALLLPTHKPLVASLIATEWDNQEKMIKPHALPMVRSPKSNLKRYDTSYRLHLQREPLTDSKNMRPLTESMPHYSDTWIRIQFGMEKICPPV
jgi:chaperone required for assembly of F1-ATPase